MWTAVFILMPRRPLEVTDEDDKRNGAGQKTASWLSTCATMFQLETQRSLRILNLNLAYQVIINMHLSPPNLICELPSVSFHQAPQTLGVDLVTML